MHQQKRKEIIELIESNNLQYKKRERKQKPITETPPPPPVSVSEPNPPPVSVSEPNPPITETNDAVGTQTQRPPLSNRSQYAQTIMKRLNGEKKIPGTE